MQYAIQHYHVHDLMAAASGSPLSLIELHFYSSVIKVIIANWIYII